MRRGFPSIFYLLIFILSVLLFFPFDFILGQSLPFAHEIMRSDVIHFSYPIQTYIGEQIRQGSIPLWCPFLGGGIPIIGQGQSAVFYPPHVIFSLIFPFPLAYNLSLAFHLVLGMFFAYHWARLIGCNSFGGVFTGFAFGFGGFMICHLHHQSLFETASYLPVIAFLIESVIQQFSLKKIGCVSIISSMILFSGHLQIAYYMSLVLVIYAIVRLLTRCVDSIYRLKVIIYLISSLIIGGLVASPQILSSLELANLGERGRGLSFEETSILDPHPTDLVLFLDPFAKGDPGVLRLENGMALGYVAHKDRRTFHWEVCGYIGIITLLFAMIPFFIPHIRVYAFLFCGIIIFTILVALGKEGLLAKVLHDYVFGFDRFRAHGRMLLFTDFFLSGLAGLGLTCIQDKLRHQKIIYRISFISPLILFIDLFITFGDYNPMLPIEMLQNPPHFLSMIDKQDGRVLVYDPDNVIFQNAYGRAKGWKGDLSPYQHAIYAMHPNLGLLYGVNSATAYTPVPTERMILVERLLKSPSTRKMIASLLGVKWIVAFDESSFPDYPSMGVFEGDVLVGHDLKPLKPYNLLLLHNPDAMPRAFLIPRARVVEGGLTAVAEEMRKDFNPRKEILLESSPQTISTEDGEIEDVNIIEDKANSVRISLNAKQDGFLFLGDSHYPGWKAYVDGIEREILPANLFGRAVFVTKGTHEVEFRYFPDWLILGGVMSAFGIACICFLMFVGGRGGKHITVSTKTW